MAIRERGSLTIIADTWAIAGRSQQKLESVKAQVGTEADVLVADSQNQAALDKIVSQTRVILNTAGPFALYCDRYHEQASSDGTRIIPCCGFDSVPSDLGAYLAVLHLRRELGAACQAVKAYFQMYGGFNGGTLASGFNLYDSAQVSQVSNPFLLNPTSEHSRVALQL